ncbi:hypothetical protein RvY_00023-2 [Ramazzottius varieornatus]|uniref:Uncharacterized protein n=1 Tax=Ramazzottius varieornatus TaxID=947166 RepID=A0A1D1UBQ0_RAMVA|nr:hypothetical protein RvY_00023-2 [Ramazzottius varieornatus]
MQRLGYPQREQYPHNQRQSILEKLIRAVDQALKNPDRKQRVEIESWLKRNLPKDPKLQLKLASDARGEVSLEDLLMTKEDLEAASKALLNESSKSGLHLPGLDESVQNIWPNDARGVLSLTELLVEAPAEPLRIFPSTYVADLIVTLVASLLEKEEVTLQKVLEMFPQLRNTFKPVETYLRKREEEKAEESRKAEEEARRRSDEQRKADEASGKVSPANARSPSKSPVKLELQHKPSARSAKEIKSPH